MVPKGFYDVADEAFDSNAVSVSSRAHSGKTYNLAHLKEGGGNVSGTFIDGKEAVSQAVVKILSTERFRYPVYSSDYGLELEDLFGKDCNYVCVELERRIADALSVDARITRVSDFDFVVGRGVIHTSFVIHTVFGEFEFRKDFDYV